MHATGRMENAGFAVQNCGGRNDDPSLNVLLPLPRMGLRGADALTSPITLA